MSGPQRRRPTVVILIGVALLLGLAAAAIRPDWHMHPLDFDLPHTRSRPSPPAMSPGSQTPPPPAKHGHTNTGQLAVVGWVLLGILIAAGLAVAVLVIRRLAGLVPARKPSQPIETGPAAEEESEPDLSTMRRGAAAAQDRMTETLAPTDAIVAGWLELEHAAAASGVSRSPAQTPTEFTTDVLARTAADGDATHTLLQLYLRARFSARDMSAEDVARARECVRSIAGSWGRVASNSDHGDAPGTGPDPGRRTS